MLFVIPWGRHWIIGTTDTPWDLDKAHPAASRPTSTTSSTTSTPSCASRSTTTTWRASTPGSGRCSPGESEPTSRISREHTVVTPVPGLVMIAGGKLTTYRVMARDAVDAAAHSLGDDRRPGVRDSITDRVPLIGADGFETRTNQRVLLARRVRAARRPDRPPARAVRRAGRRPARADRRAARLGVPLEGAEGPRRRGRVRRHPRGRAPPRRRADPPYPHLDRDLRPRRARGPGRPELMGRRARLGRRPRWPTRSITTCGGSRPSGRSQTTATDQEADEARVSAPDIV